MNIHIVDYGQKLKAEFISGQSQNNIDIQWKDEWSECVREKKKHQQNSNYLQYQNLVNGLLVFALWFSIFDPAILVYGSIYTHPITWFAGHSNSVYAWIQIEEPEREREREATIT